MSAIFTPIPVHSIDPIDPIHLIHLRSVLLVGAVLPIGSVLPVAVLLWGGDLLARSIIWRP